MTEKYIKKSFLLRLDPGLYSAIEISAAKDFRSINNEIEVLLRDALLRRGINPGQFTPIKRGRPSQNDSKS